ncbi:MAG: restriction endonuclease [Pedobacter sp.]|nr:MAG: restriction endonuclease [Pedobacter sp.]
MKSLKEHNKLTLPEDFDFQGLESYLQDVWKHRYTLYDEQDEEEQNTSTQQFLSFLREQEVKAGHYVGFVQFKDLQLCIYPKLFDSLKNDNVSLFYRHLLYWLSYCRRINFPFNKVEAELSYLNDFPEALVHYFAKHTLHLLQQHPYHQFELIEETLPQVKGRLLTSRYINECITKGNFHHLVCEHEPLLFDNTLNSIIKFVTRRLLQRSRFKETWYYLEQIIFVLDEVEDEVVTARDCDRVKLNPLFTDYKECLDMCRFFLNNEQIKGLQGSDDQFCFLLPMNYVFEDFLCGFIEDKFRGQFKAVYQHGGWLTDQRVFRIMNDLGIKNEVNDLLLIVDAKYKLRQRNVDAKKGINQADLYQMAAYAIRQNCKKVLLLYPLLYSHKPTHQTDTFTISSELFDGTISVTAADLHICSLDTRELDEHVYQQLEELFNELLNTD